MLVAGWRGGESEGCWRVLLFTGTSLVVKAAVRWGAIRRCWVAACLPARKSFRALASRVQFASSL